MTFETTRKNVTTHVVTSIPCDRADVSVFIKFGRELDEAVAAGMPLNTPVRKLSNRLEAVHVVTQEIP